MPKSDRWIRKMAQEHDMINPFSEKQVREGVISYGLSSYGYDLRVADEFKIFTNVNCTVVDPKNFDERSFVTVRSECSIVPPNSFALARSVEKFKYLQAFAFVMAPFAWPTKEETEAIWFALCVLLLAFFVRLSLRALPDRRLS